MRLGLIQNSRFGTTFKLARVAYALLCFRLLSPALSIEFAFYSAFPQLAENLWSIRRPIIPND